MPISNYNFVTGADVLDAVRAAMSAEGLCLFISMGEVKKEIKRTVIDFQFTFADGASGQSMSVNWVGEAIDTQDKGIAKAATSALKYCLLKTFLIATGDESDSDNDGPSILERRGPAAVAGTNPSPAPKAAPGQRRHPPR